MADISLDAVAGKLNRVGYEALFKALRQAAPDEEFHPGKSDAYDRIDLRAAREAEHY